jgi:hypothetical protein
MLAISVQNDFFHRKLEFPAMKEGLSFLSLSMIFGGHLAFDRFPKTRSAGMSKLLGGRVPGPAAGWQNYLCFLGNYLNWHPMGVA